MASETDIVWRLRVEEQDTEGVAVIACTGRVSKRTSPLLEQALGAAIASPARGLVLDLSNVDYISSPGLRAVETASVRLDGEGRAFVVCGLKDAVDVAFALAGLGASLAIEPSRELAVKRAGA